MVATPNVPLVPGQVRVVVERVEETADTITTHVRVVEGTIPEDLGSPASFWNDTGPTFDLHRGTRTGPDVLRFVTFGADVRPAPGDTLRVQWWWIPGTERLLWPARDWTRAPVDSAHCFCPLTYDELEEGDEAYTDGEGHWISVLGWEQFVRDDALRLRSGT